jgi:tetratricopeptide (TPR) repeat protein
MRSATKVFIVLVVVLGVVSLSGCGVLGKLKARDELNKGVRAYKGGDFEGAIEHFRVAIDADPTLLNARVYLATAYASQFVPGAPSEENQQVGDAAISEFEKVLEQDPGNTTALAYIAQIYFGMAAAAGSGEDGWDDAIELFGKSKEYRRRLMEVDQQNPEHYYSVGVVNWTLAYRPRMAKKRDLGLSPDQPLPRREREALAEQNGEVVEEGIEVLEQALKLDPQYLDAIAYLNLMYREKAELAADPQQREAFLQRADELHERHQQLREQQTAPTAPAG